MQAQIEIVDGDGRAVDLSALPAGSVLAAEVIRGGQDATLLVLGTVGPDRYHLGRVMLTGALSATREALIPPPRQSPEDT